MAIQNGNLDNDRTTTTKATSVRNNMVRKIARVTRADRSAEQLDSETGGEQTTVDSTLLHVGRMADDRLLKRAA